LFSVVAVFVVPLGGLALYKWDSSENRGSKFGYWGEFNRTGKSLASIPGISISNGWYNGDVTLEEFGFDITV
jgi:hypothetical protein